MNFMHIKRKNMAIIAKMIYGFHKHTNSIKFPYEMHIIQNPVFKSY
jgi:hypothetical protein